MNHQPLHSFFTSSGLVSQAKAEEMSVFFDAAEYRRSSYLLKEGAVCDTYLFLQSGFMRSFAHDIDGKEITTNFYSPGSVVFEVSSFFQRNRSKENIIALADCTGWQISYEGLNRLFHEIPEFREFGRSILVRNLAQLKTRMLSMITETAEERYTQLVDRQPEVFRFAALKDIATYLGVTDTSLSRIRRELSSSA
jgi:CRP-like cAMP-binding protein